MTDPILIETDNRIAFVTFNRPGRLNAIDLAMARAFREAVERLEARDDVRAVVLRGAGAAFVSGGDITLFRGDRDQAVATIGELIDHFHAATIGLQRLAAPVIASVHGAAAGGGFSLALAADLRIAADTATFTPAYLRLGASPDGGGTFFLTRLVGASKALEIFLLGGTFPAAEALRLGFVNRVVPAADLARETTRLAETVARGAMPAVAHAKALMIGRDLAALERQLAAEKQAFLDCVRSGDFEEGVAAFLAKRPPQFTGEQMQPRRREGTKNS
jgi:2-(1,2-epoxy-1,2-dihydrophenyl)acetyl-CoA isomerase